MMENEPRMTQRILLPTANGYEPHDAASLQSLRRTFWIDGPVDARQAADAVNMLLQFDSDSHEEITMLIHSNGGIIDEGLAILDIMHAVKSPIRTVAVGMAASMGAMIFTGGTKGRRVVLPSAKVLIHEPLITGSGPMNVSDIIELGEHMKKLKAKMNRILAECTGKSEEQIDEDTKEDKIFTAEEAVAYGLADEIGRELPYGK